MNPPPRPHKIYNTVGYYYADTFTTGLETISNVGNANADSFLYQLNGETGSAQWLKVSRANKRAVTAGLAVLGR